MKKLFTLIVALFASVCIQAQVNVVDAAGNVCQEGGVLDFHDEMPDLPLVMMGSPKLVNTSDAPVSVYFDVNIRQLPEGTSFDDCFSGVCVKFAQAGTHQSGAKDIDAQATMPTLMEWNCYDSQNKVNVEGICIVDFVMYVNGEKSLSFTARYINGDVSKVKGLATDAVKTQGTFSLDGKRLQGEAKGLVIRNGKKVLVK